MNLDNGQQGYIYQKNNRLLAAAISATISPSARQPLVYPVTKTGRGNLLVQGNYEGADDAQYDVKVVDDTFTTPIVSSPVFEGAGTGKISAITASGLAAQQITVRCMSTGVTTQASVVEIEGLLFRAKTGGAAGNAINIDVDDSTLVFTATDYSTIKALAVNDTGLDGPEWDFDTKVILGDIIPSTAHRLSFGLDRLHIYRQYKKFESGGYKYHFVHPIKYPVPAGTKVYFVTDGRTITVSDGVTTEEYTDIVTIADFWSAVRNTSTLIEPLDSAIDTSLIPSSPAVREFTVKTDSYALPPYRDDRSSIHAGALTNIVTKAGTKTELIEVRCIDNTYVGAELWEVKGSSSGALGQGRTGEINDYGPVVFEVPQKLPPDFGAPKEDWSHEVNYVSRGTGINPPPICFSMRLGINAAAHSLTLEYKKKPTACSCPTVRFGDACLGFEEKGGEIGMAYTVPDLVFWTDAVRDRMAEAAYTSESGETYEGESYYGANFLTASKKYFDRLKVLAARIMALTEDDAVDLAAMIAAYKALVLSISVLQTYAAVPIWSLNETLPLGTVRIPTTPNTYYYKVVTAGTTGGIEPTWPTTAGETVIDGTVVWECLGTTFAEFTWTDATSEWSAPFIVVFGYQDINYDLTGYQALVDDVLEYERTYGLKKNSIIAPGTCYTDSESEYYWEVRGNKAYLPAFTDTPYYSTIKQGEAHVATKEFALNISVPCGGTLLEGDKITVTIGGIMISRTYLIGDTTYLPTIAAQALYLTGGIDGDDTYVFEVRGTVAGAFTNYLLDRTAPAPYVGTGLGLTITDGIIPFQVDDNFSFNIEGGHFKWRKGAGAWSAAVAISKAYQEIDAGVEVAFEFGVSPSFVIDDQWEILCRQENKASHIADISKFTALKASGTITFDLGSSVAVDTIVLDLHDITGTFDIQASDLSNFSALLYDETITAADLICLLFETEDIVTARYWRFVLAGEHTIGFGFIGSLMQLSKGMDADTVRQTGRYNIIRQEGKEPISLTKYKISGYSVEYSSILRHADFMLLAELIDYLKLADDQPLYFIPNINYPAYCMRGRIETDNLEVGSDLDHNLPPENRLYTLTIPISGAQ